MSGLAPNSSNYQRVSRAVDQAVHLLVHPEYEYWLPEWRKIRDALRGQKEIKQKSESYLKRMKGMDDEDYEIYLDRALFYNMTAQTLNGMIGQVFRREPIVRNLPDKFKNAVRKFAKDGTSHIGLAKTSMGEQLSLARFGILVDAAASVQLESPSSYAVGYQTEDILDWTVEEVDGFYRPTRVLLREYVRDDSLSASNAPSDTVSRRGAGPRVNVSKARAGMQPKRSYTNFQYKVIYRELLLIPHPRHPQFERVYVQRLYDTDPQSAPSSEVVPVIRGVPLPFIPFQFFGSRTNTADIEPPPLNDIVDINLSHYRTYAELEYGRTFTALPVYYAPGGNDEGASAYHIGPNMVWEVPPDGSEPGILEYKGEGLKALEKALEQKEQQIASIGGRLMPGASRSISESNNQTALRESNEQSLLLNAIQACEEGFAEVIRWWLMFRDVPLIETQGLRYEFNTQFLSTPIGARELRAMQLMYKEGIITDQIYYEFLKKAEVVPSSWTFEEYQKARKDPNSFVNNPDAQARQRGYSDRKQELGVESTEFEQDILDREIEIEEEKLEIAAKVGSTTVAASRKLGDPEQAEPAKADKLSAKKAAAKPSK